MKIVPGQQGTTFTRERLQAVLERLHTMKHTGPVIIHLSQGCALVVEIPAEPERILLDTGRSVAQS